MRDQDTQDLVNWVAEKLMEWKRDLYGTKEWMWVTPNGIVLQSEWNPDTDLNHTFMVVEKMREKGLEININSTSLKKFPRFKVIFFTASIPFPEHKEYSSEDDNLCLAILKAAKAVWEGKE
jgi:hypothetical protein